MVETTEEYRTRINQLKTEIETEPLIKEMRSDIAEGIHKTGNRQADIELKFSELEGDFEHVQRDASSVAPIGAELAVARGFYDTLDERLDTEEEKVASQLAQTHSDLSESMKSEAEDRASTFVPNSDEKLNIPTYDGSGQTTHPKAIFIEDGWGGYKFWMTHSPYPYENNYYENPSIIASHDGENWETPSGLANPLDSVVLNSGTYNSDPVIFINGNVMEIWWRYVDSKGSNIYRRTSTDGKSWTQKELLFTWGVSDILSPDVVFEDSLYKMWYVKGNGDIGYGESQDGKNWVNEKTIKWSYPNYYAWHIDVLKIGKKIELVVYAKRSDNATGSLFYSTSYDNVNYTSPIQILKPRLGTTQFDNSTLYKSSLVKVKDEYFLYYCGIKKDRSNWLGLVKGNSPLTLGVGKGVMSSVLRLPNDSITPNTPIESYPANVMMKTNITTAHALTHGFPLNRAGELLTDNIIAEPGRQREVYTIYNSNQKFERYTDTSGNWTPFVETTFKRRRLEVNIPGNTIPAGLDYRQRITWEGITPKDVIVANSTGDIPILCSYDVRAKLGEVHVVFINHSDVPRTYEAAIWHLVAL